VRVFVTSDSDVRTGVGEVNDQIGEEIARFFKPRSYGEAIQAVVVCLMCRDPMYRFIGP
jgi:hypothetical protein